jgi:hypothetical protein
MTDWTDISFEDPKKADAVKAAPVLKGVCPKCGKHIAKGVGFHRETLQGSRMTDIPAILADLGFTATVASEQKTTLVASGPTRAGPTSASARPFQPMTCLHGPRIRRRDNDNPCRPHQRHC